ALPSQKAARLALRTQQVIAYETDVTKTVDPFAGSYVMESMTNDMEEAVVALMQAVEDRGGAVSAIEQGFQKAEIERSAYRIALEIDEKERTIIGLNKYTLDEEDPFEPLRADPTIEAEQCERLAVLRKARDNDSVSRALDAVRSAGTGTDNVLLPMRDALAAHATGGEIAHALRDVWGTYVANDTF
ncbi:MAG: methylmalonyl-CoA mutase family protein, partial [Dermatophilaceae bacterium]